jgi:hypothetical protein
MMEAVRTSEKSVNVNVTTRRYIAEDSKLHTRRRENLKSHNDPILPDPYLSAIRSHLPVQLDSI